MAPFSAAKSRGARPRLYSDALLGFLPQSGYRPEATERNRLLQLLCSSVALIIGAVAAWAARTTMYPDGVSYLDIGDAYWRGNWHTAINAYWSPLYSWIVGGVFRLLRPSIDQEFPLVHVVNFAMYLIALAAFSYFLKIFVESGLRNRGDAFSDEMTLPAWAMYVGGYAAFLISSLLLITIGFVSADMLVAAIVFFVSALLLKIQDGRATVATFIVLGLALGVGYYAKTVMLPMSLPFLIVAAALQRRAGKSLKPVAYALCVIIVLAVPFVSMISLSKGRLTIGESGKFNYLVNVGTVNFFIPREPSAHPVPRVSGPIEAYEYPRPISATYPLWFDPSYWHEGIKIPFSVSRQLRRIALSLLECGWILLSVFIGLHLTVAILFLYFISPNPLRCVSAVLTHWVLWVPALAAIAMYALLIVEPRYLGAQFCILWIIGLAGVRLPRSQSSKHFISFAVVVIVLISCALVIRDTWRIAHTLGVDERDIATPECARAARALVDLGIEPRDRIAVVSNWLFPSRQGAYIARLARARIIGEAQAADFWAADDAARTRVVVAFANAGARMILTRNPPPSARQWRVLADTSYYVFTPARSASGTDSQETTP